MPVTLIIDDDEIARLAMAFALEKAGCEVHHCGDVTEGLRYLHANPVDVVLLDVEMTPTDGVQCLMAIRADEKLAATNVIMVSGRPQKDLIVRIARLGVRGMVVKKSGYIHEVVKRVEALAQPEPAVTVAEAAEQARAAVLAASESQVAHQARREGTGASRARVALNASAEPSAIACDRGHIDAVEALNQLKTIKPLLGRQELLERVLSGNELKAMGPAARQVLSLAGSSTASVDAVSKAIKQDQAMSLRILKLANSSHYRRGAPVDTVGKAVARIGIEQIRQTILSMSVLERFGAAGISGRIRADWFWEHGIATGLFAAGIARSRGATPEFVDAIFTAGLLHDVGRILFAERLGDVYAGVLEVADRLELPLEAVETRLLLINHADLTDRLLREWTFPADLIYPIAYHHLSVGNIRNIAPRALPEVATLALANRLAHSCLLGTSGNDVIYPLEEFATALDLKKGVVAELCETVPDMTLDMRMTMMSHSNEVGTASIDLVKETLGGEFRALSISCAPEYDAGAHMLRRLGVEARDEAPKVLLVRVAAAGERARLMDLIKEAEANAGVTNLPVLVLASSSSCFFTQGALGPRRLEQAVMPVRMERLLRMLTSMAGVSQVAKAA